MIDTEILQLQSGRGSSGGPTYPGLGVANREALDGSGGAQSTDVRVAVYTSDSLILPGLIDELRAHGGLETVAGPASADATVVVTGRRGRPVLALLESVRDAGGGVVVLVTDERVDPALLAMVRLGLMAVVRRSRLPVGRLGEVVLGVVRGQGSLPPDVLGALLRSIEGLQRDVLEPHGLTPIGLLDQEVGVLRLVAEGLSTIAIAEQLHCSERTVKYVMSRVLTRHRLRNRDHAVAVAICHGLI